MSVSADFFCSLNAAAGEPRAACERWLELGRSHDWAPPPPPQVVGVVPPALAGVVGLAVLVVLIGGAVLLLAARRWLRRTRAARQARPALAVTARPGQDGPPTAPLYKRMPTGAATGTAPQGGPSC